MRSMIGFWMICEAILLVIVSFCGIDLSAKAKAEMILLLTVFFYDDMHRYILDGRMAMRREKIAERRADDD